MKYNLLIAASIITASLYCLSGCMEPSVDVPEKEFEEEFSKLTFEESGDIMEDFYLNEDFLDSVAASPDGEIKNVDFAYADSLANLMLKELGYPSELKINLLSKEEGQSMYLGEVRKTEKGMEMKLHYKGLNRLDQAYGNNLGSVLVIAHEVGHYLYSDPDPVFDGQTSGVKQEKNADIFSGKLLFILSKPLKSIKQVFDAIVDKDYYTNCYGSKEYRKLYVEYGYLRNQIHYHDIMSRNYQLPKLPSSVLSRFNEVRDSIDKYKIRECNKSDLAHLITQHAMSFKLESVAKATFMGATEYIQLYHPEASTKFPKGISKDFKERIAFNHLPVEFWINERNQVVTLDSSSAETVVGSLERSRNYSRLIIGGVKLVVDSQDFVWKIDRDSTQRIGLIHSINLD